MIEHWEYGSGRFELSWKINNRGNTSEIYERGNYNEPTGRMKGHLFIVSDILVHDVRIGWQWQAPMADFKVYSKKE